MFRELCSSSGGQNCVTQPLVSSHFTRSLHLNLTLIAAQWAAHSTHSSLVLYPTTGWAAILATCIFFLFSLV